MWYIGSYQTLFKGWGLPRGVSHSTQKFYAFRRSNFKYSDQANNFKLLFLTFGNKKVNVVYSPKTDSHLMSPP